MNSQSIIMNIAAMETQLKQMRSILEGIITKENKEVKAPQVAPEKPKKAESPAVHEWNEKVDAVWTEMKAAGWTHPISGEAARRLDAMEEAGFRKSGLTREAWNLQQAQKKAKKASKKAKKPMTPQTAAEIPLPQSQSAVDEDVEYILSKLDAPSTEKKKKVSKKAQKDQKVPLFHNNQKYFWCPQTKEVWRTKEALLTDYVGYYDVDTGKLYDSKDSYDPLGVTHSWKAGSQ